MKKAKLFSVVLVVSIFALSLIKTDQAQARQDSWNYAKNAYFAVDMEEKCLYWIEECTINAGSQCAQSGGAFRTCVLTFELPKLPKIDPLKL